MEQEPGKGGSAALRIVLVYVIVGSLWILLSDRAVAFLIKNPDTRVYVSIFKGWVYVLATGAMLYALIRQHTRALSHANEALRDTEERYRQLFELSPDAVIVHREGRIVLVNQAGAALLHASRVDDLLGRSVLDLVHPDDRETIQHRVERMMKQESVPPAEIRVVRPDGTLAYAELISRPFTYEGNAAVLTLARDVTERRMLEENKRDFYRRTILAATEGKLVITDKDEISRIAGPETARWQVETGEELGPIRSEMQQRAVARGMDEPRAYDLMVCVGEATTNALKHAGSGTASIHESVDSIIFVVSDSGPGIEALALPELALKKGYTTGASLGMGYKAMISLADRVYLATGPEGTTVAVEMKLRAPEAPSLLAGLVDTWAE